MKNLNSFACYVLLVLCLQSAFAQFIGQQQQTQFGDLTRQRSLSPQQQGHILSDIQQHHRFNVHQNVLTNPQQTFAPTQFGRQQQQQQPTNQFNQQFPQQSFQQQTIIHNQQQANSNQQNQLNQNQLLQQNQQLLNQQNQFSLQNQLNQNPLLNQPIIPTNQPLLPNQGQAQGFGPTSQNQITPTLNSQIPTGQQQLINGRQIVQHHTQTSFTPSYSQQNLQAPTNAPNNVQQQQIFNQKFQASPQSDPLFTTSQTQQLGQIDPEKQKQRLKELKDKQAIIDKHNQFVEKQYEKALKKAQTDHLDFLESQKKHKSKLYQNLYSKPNVYETLHYTQTNPRYIYPEESDLFRSAVKKYYDDHPTTTTTTTTTPKPTTTTERPKPTTARSLKSKQNDDSELYLSASNSKLFNQIKLATQDKESTASSDHNKQVQFLPTVIPNRKTIQSLDDLNQLKKQYKTQQINKDDILAQLRLAIGENAEDELSKNITSREISLPNGQRVQIIRTSDPNSIPGAKALDLSAFAKPATTSRPPKAILDELTKGINLPPGSNFELLKQGSGGLEQVGGLPTNLPGQKKVTFVLLEEQNDGSFKVQGVKGNSKEKSEVDVDSILKRIKDGDIKLPPNTKIQNAESSSNGFSSTLEPVRSTYKPIQYSSSTPKYTKSTTTTMEIIPSISVSPNSLPPSASDDVSHTPILQTNIGTQFIASSTPSTYTSPFYTHSNSVHSTTPRSIDGPSPKSLEDFESIRLSSSASNDLIRQASTAATLNQNSIFSSPFPSASPKPTNPTYPTKPTFPPSPSYQNNAVTIFQSHSTALPSTISALGEEPLDVDQDELPEVLKRSGLYAMARFLRQSGLDTILNETGPYTVFAPTDKAFRTLLVQLGGPEKAEEKFRENPRLLSGLLLHHVIPGSFKIDNLQDEMTGVSLAGTQLRVNQYNMHDLEWNDVKITTINGAKIMDDKKDIEIPQGIAHSIDRVMFPLPVGDIVQTLQSDRERRFTNFLRALFASGLAETLQGTKTFTLFAPTDKAFSALTSDELTRTVSDRTLSRELVMRHLTPGTLYTNGMRYYQIRDSLEPNRQITLSKSSGRIKVNNNQIATQNIPATNGVIHALDIFL